MCGIAEATLAMSVVSEVAGAAQSQQQARDTANAQRKMDQAAYKNYLINHDQLNKRADQVRQTSAQKSMAQAVEEKRVVGRARVHYGEQGMGGFALTGNTVDSYFNNIALQTAIGGQRLRQETDDNLDNIFLHQEAAYANYQARNASFTPTPYTSWGDALLEIGEAGVGYMGNDQRQYFKNKKTAPSGNSSLLRFGSIG